MLASLIIVFREVFEAGLIVGIVLAATQGIAGRAAWLAGGIGAGVLGAAVLALFAGALENALRRQRAGGVQRRHPDRRRRHAELAPALDGEATAARWPAR